MRWGRLDIHRIGHALLEPLQWGRSSPLDRSCTNFAIALMISSEFVGQLIAMELSAIE